jgi:hypothetical protein
LTQHTKACIDYNDNYFPAVPYELCICGANIHDQVIELRADMDLSSEEIISIIPSMTKRLDQILEDLTNMESENWTTQDPREDE